MIELDDNIELVFPLIDYEEYWKRSCLKHFKEVDVRMHGNSWKQCFAENYLRKKIIDFEPKNEENDIVQYFNLFKFYIFNLNIPFFRVGIDITLISKYLVNLTSLELKYSPKLRDTHKEVIFKRKITRNKFTKLSNKG